MTVEMPVVMVMREKTADCLQAFASRQLKQEFKDLKRNIAKTEHAVIYLIFLSDPGPIMIYPTK